MYVTHLVDIHHDVHDIPNAGPAKKAILPERAGLRPDERCHAQQSRHLCNYRTNATRAALQLRQALCCILIPQGKPHHEAVWTEGNHNDSQFSRRHSRHL